jgi:hypothetical protein
VRQVRQRLEYLPFEGCGLGDHIIKALLHDGITQPERLLPMTLAQLRGIPRIGRNAFEEIVRYRTSVNRAGMKASRSQ